ncbi:type II CAAX prenyl endopeptidase Rce1 family protein [Paenibacillus shunpengii]|uniref:Type II CAAX prenyl endopeptidase Rce1 family protein n=1 Tax=Paenibacillus shunpengii TaxID=2054424 RepID=A0ABW5SM65_9BACL
MKKRNISESEKGLDFSKGLTLELLGWLSMVIALFTATLIGRQIEQSGYPYWVSAGTKGIITSFIVVTVVFWIRRRYPNQLKLTPLSRVGLLHLLSGAMLPLLLVICGFIIASQLNWIEIVEWHFSYSLFFGIILNVCFAFLYEALPEELTMRGLVYSGLRVKLPAFLAYAGQIFLFVLVPVTVNFLQQLVGMEPGVEINTDYILLLIAFGTVLQLLRSTTGSLWASIGFHLSYLEISRFMVAQNDLRLLTYSELHEGTGSLFILFTMVILVGILIVGAFSIWLRTNGKKAKR